MVLFANLKVAVGGKDNVLEGVTDRIHMLHDAIASDAAQPKTEDIEHAFENFFSSRVIRRMIIDCPAFAVTLWRKALKGKCKIWAEGHRYHVLLVDMMPCTRASNTHVAKCLCHYAEHVTTSPLLIVICESSTTQHLISLDLTIYILDVLVIAVLRWLQRSWNLQVLR